jgi:serine protease Do
LPDFVSVVEKVKPSVVIIHAGSSEGSGWIIDSDGIIVTNNHVVEGADTDTILVTLDDGRTFTVESVWADPITDLAILKIDARNLPAADVNSSSELKVGQPVAAIGNALGKGISMKGGWISRLGVSVFIEGQWLYGLIETDAAINRGNSGGPLVNMAGEVIGITSVKLIDVEVEGVGYAISLETALPVIEALVNVGFVVYPFLGVWGLHTVNPAVASFFELGVDRGVMIIEVVPGAPAEEAGLQANDVIVAVDDEEVTVAEELVQLIRSKDVGQRIKISYYRGSSQGVTYVTLVEMPPE